MLWREGGCAQMRALCAGVLLEPAPSLQAGPLRQSHAGAPARIDPDRGDLSLIAPSPPFH